MKGRFKPKNIKKYDGDPTNIIYRSSLEFKFMTYLDKSPEIRLWSSEEIIVPYKSPLDGKMHRYFPDFRVVMTEGQIYLIEIKPLCQTTAPLKQNKVTKRYLREVAEWGKNEAKWNAALKYARKHGWTFHILTETDLKMPKWS